MVCWSTGNLISAVGWSKYREHNDPMAGKEPIEIHEIHLCPDLQLYQRNLFSISETFKVPSFRISLSNHSFTTSGFVLILDFISIRSALRPSAIDSKRGKYVETAFCISFSIQLSNILYHTEQDPQ